MANQPVPQNDTEAKNYLIGIVLQQYDLQRTLGLDPEAALAKVLGDTVPKPKKPMQQRLIDSNVGDMTDPHLRYKQEVNSALYEGWKIVPGTVQCQIVKDYLKYWSVVVEKEK